MLRTLAACLTAIACCAAAEDGAAWIRHPAIAPDGRRIAFAQGGQIWIVPVAGGEAIPLTDGLDYCTRPVWSPDGTRLAFASSRFGNPDVFIMPAEGGRSERLTWNSAADAPLSFTPDGREVYLASGRLGDPAADALDAVKGLGVNLMEQLYAVPADGGRTRMVLPTPALEAQPARDGRRLLYADHPSIENEWRKHHVSDATRDIWLYDAGAGTHRRLTSFRGEDRNPVWAPGDAAMLWLSERSGSLNVWRQPLEGGEAEQVTRHAGSPVRFLSIAGDGTLAYAWDGGIWILPAGQADPRRVAVRMRQSGSLDGARPMAVNGQATELAVSPDRSEFAVVARGEVFVVSAADGSTRRITGTPAAERNVSFAPDGRSLLYASERDGTWDVWQAALRRAGDRHFTGAAPFDERKIIDGAGDSFQPVWSPDGKRIAYREDRNSLRVHELGAGTSIELLPREAVYSYTDDDLAFAWSPDGRWIAVRTGFMAGNAEVELVDAAGREPRRNLSRSGFTDLRPSVSADGRAVLWLSDRAGLRAADSSAAQLQVFAAFLTPEAFAAFRGREAEKGAAPAGLPDLDGIEARTVQLSPFSADLLFYRLSGDGRRLAVVTATPQGMLAGYCVDVRSGQAAPLFQRPPMPPIAFAADAGGTAIYALGPASIDRYDLAGGPPASVPFAAVMERDALGEIAAIFEHAWRLTKAKFYDARLHGVDWEAVGAHYRRFLPRVRHWEELAEILSEMAGELNASHQGSSYLADQGSGDATASLGVYADPSHRGDGVRIAAVLPGGPADLPASALRPGALLLAVDGVPLTPRDDADRLLNRKAGKPVLLAIRPAGGGAEVEETVIPIAPAEEAGLAYRRWVGTRRALTARLSQGRLGYIHLPRMDLESYQQAYSDLFGRHGDAEAVVVDVRFNGGGNLHDALIAMLTGQHHSDLVTRYGAAMGRIPGGRWAKPSALVANAGSYSDGSVFPALYQRHRIGPIIGERVPGTGTAVVWEHQIEPRLVYGVPQLGFRFRDGTWFENTEVVPDLLLRSDPAAIASGADAQLERAVAVLLERLGKAP